MDATIVNVAIPAIRTELGASPAQLQWVIDVYTLVLASLLLLAGATADRFGRRRVFQIGLTVFAAGSLLCSLAPNIHTLIGARFVQAIGGSMLNPVAMSIITQVFTGRVERARAVGVVGRRHRNLDGAWPDGRWRVDRVCRLAVGVLDQPADLRGRDHPDRDLRPGVALGHDARRRPDRSGARGYLLVRCRVRPDPGPGDGVDGACNAGHFGRRGRGVGGVHPVTRHVATIRSSISGSSAASRSRRPRSSRSARPHRTVRSCS